MSERVERVDTDTLHIDDMHVVRPRAAGLDVHKMRITAAVRLCEAGGGPARTAVREFSALPHGLRAMTDRLLSHRVAAAAMESTGVCWKAPFEALEDADIPPLLFHARHVKQIRGKKTDVSDSLRLARICQFGLAMPSHVPPRRFRRLRRLTRFRRTLVAERSRNRNRVHKTLDHDGLRLGGILSDIFGVNGRRILDGLAAGQPPRVILAGLTNHVAAKLEPPARTLTAALDPLALLKLKMQLEALDRADAALAALDNRIQTEMAECQRPLRLLQTIPGIDVGSACIIPAEIGPDPGAFRQARHLGAVGALGECRPQGPVARTSPSGAALAGAGVVARSHPGPGAARTKSSQFHGCHRTLAGRLGYKRAILATARKLLRVIHAVLREDRRYADPDIDLRAPRRRAQRAALDPHAPAARLPGRSPSRGARLTRTSRIMRRCDGP